VHARLAIAILSLLFAATAAAQDKKQRVEKVSDLPTFTYKVDGKLEDIVRDPAKFKAFSADVRRDTESVLAKYDIADKAKVRELMTLLVRLDVLEGRNDAALRGALAVRALEEKPADKLLSGVSTRAIVEARRVTGSDSSDAYRREVARLVGADIAGMPPEIIQNDIKEAKRGVEIISEALALGYVNNVLQPTVDKAGSLSSDLAPALVGARYRIVIVFPLKSELTSTYTAYLAAHTVDKPDIWAARGVELPPGRNYTPVVIAVWDSGVDSPLFAGRMVMDASGKPALIAFDKYSDPATGELAPIPAELRERVPQMKSRLKGLSDLQSNIDSPEATEVKQLLSTLKPDQYTATIEEISTAGQYIHGTHVAGISVAGNPYAKLVIARIEFNPKLLPDPCPTVELAEKDARNAQAYVDFMKKNGVRVVNMSWGGTVKGVEDQLEQCGTGKTPDERKALAAKIFALGRDSLTKAFASAPDILFITAAGNSNQDASFAEDIPADIVLPNLLTVGAVDKAGDEASFTSYGKTVVAHANGYQVESVIPGGQKLAESGTSMAAPQATNLAAKMLAVNPKLTPVQVIAIIRETADKSADGRRMLINPKKAVAAAQARA
jgi:subtilisin family serine protease